MFNMEELFEEKVLTRGRRYYNNGRVQFIYKTKNGYEATVYGRNIYKVVINLDKKENIKNMICTCPYGISNCKHMAAVLYYLNNNDDIEEKEENVEEDNYIDKIIEKIPQADINEFLIMQMEYNNELERNFKSRFAKYFQGLTKQQWREKIKNTIFAVTGGGYLEEFETWKFSDAMYNFIHQARELVNNKRFEEAFWIVSLILEEMPDAPIDDSDGTTGDISDSCSDVVESILEKCDNKEIRNEVLKWIDKSLKDINLSIYLDKIERLMRERK